MVGGALTAIFFILTLVCWAIWTALLSLFIAHYTLTILSDSSSGHEEVQYPDESFFDWWWKPPLFAWVLLMFLVPSAIILSPLGAFSAEAFSIVWLLVIWCLYPLGLACVLYTGNWLRIVHFSVLGRMFLHLPALAYVYVVTLAVFAGAIWLTVKTFTDSLLWGIPAIICVPMAFLLFARHWGRFAWLSLNHLPRYARPGRAEKRVALESRPGWPEGEIPKVDEVDEKKASTSEPNAWGETDPYTILADPDAPSFEEKHAPAAPVDAPAPVPAAPLAADEEEDEWSLDKKPYDLTEPVSTAPSASSSTHPKKPGLDQPVAVAAYYEERARKEKRRAGKAEEAKRTLPPMSKKTPTFVAALVVGVWGFLAQPGTLSVWGNLIVLMLIEFFLIYMMVMFVPK
jgi:hypothetical protein